MKGKVIKITSMGYQDFNNMFKWEVTIEDEKGQAVYNRFYPKDSLNFSEGDEITFETNEKGSMKNVNRGSGQNPEVAAKLGQEAPQLDRDSYWNEKLKLDISIQPMIHRQSSLERAHEYCKELLHSNRAQKIEPYDILKVAQYYVDWVETGEMIDVNPLDVE